MSKKIAFIITKLQFVTFLFVSLFVCLFVYHEKW